MQTSQQDLGAVAKVHWREQKRSGCTEDGVFHVLLLIGVFRSGIPGNRAFEIALAQVKNC